MPTTYVLDVQIMRGKAMDMGRMAGDMEWCRTTAFTVHLKLGIEGVPRGKFLCPERGIRTRQCPDRGTKSLVVIKVLKLIINDHYHKGKGSKIVNHKICKVRVPKEENRQRVRGVSKGTKANEENKEEVCENEESVQRE